MITELRKSIHSILYQRVSSPFFGTLILSWVIWNWRIVYLTLFINAKEIGKNKIEYITSEFSDVNFLLWYPIASTIVLLTLVPFVSNGAYWLSLKFEKWKKDQKNSIEKKQLLTLEQSIQLREEIVESEKRFDTLLQSKNDEIKQLKALLSEYQDSKEETDDDAIQIGSNEDKEEREVIEIYNRVKDNSELRSAVESINYYIQGGYPGLGDKVSTNSLSFFESNDLIESKKPGFYTWTLKGKRLNKLMVNLEFN